PSKRSGVARAGDGFGFPQAAPLGAAKGLAGCPGLWHGWGSMAQAEGPSPSFWDDVGANFPSLKGAVSTAYYFDCERWLFETYLPKLGDLVVFKTDLWDEAKNTEILRWAADHDARPMGVDVSIDVVREARKVLRGHRPGFVVGDVRAI